jgi:hypothetical protein
MSFFGGGSSERRFLSNDFFTPPELVKEAKAIKSKTIKMEKKPDDKEATPLDIILKNKKVAKKDIHEYFENLISELNQE